MAQTVMIVLITPGGLALFLAPGLRRRPMWRAMITPLASIIGSGFLVLGPVLINAYGPFAPLVMAGLCMAAWFFGAAVRANIATLDTGAQKVARQRLETAADWVLAFGLIVTRCTVLKSRVILGLNMGLPCASDPCNRRQSSLRWFT